MIAKMRLLKGAKSICTLFSSNNVNYHHMNFDWKNRGYNYVTMYAQTKFERESKRNFSINHKLPILRKYCKSLNKTKVIYFDAKYIHSSKIINNDKDLKEVNKNLLPSKVLQGNGISSEEWEQIVTELKNNSKHINNLNIHSLIMKACRWAENYHLATSYVDYLKSKGQEMNLSTHGTYLHICGLNVDVCGEDRVIEVYQQLLRRVKIMDANLSEKAVIALSNTSSWQQLFKHLPIIRHMCSISVNVYSYIISAAFRNGEHALAWKYLDEMYQTPTIYAVDKDFIMISIKKIIQSWLAECSKEVNPQQQQSKLRILLTKMQMYHITPSTASAKSIQSFCLTHLDWCVEKATIYRSGHCTVCGNKLASAQISDEEFEKLKWEFTEDVLKGSDIFRATSPEEWENFRKFVEINVPFTHVVDALNVSLKVGGRDRQMLLEKVISNLTNQEDAKVLVIGRKHLSKMINKVKLRIGRGAIFFNLENMSKDDGFFIYAALQSGQGTKIVTSDLLRDHLARLKDPSMKRIFRFWQKSHQIYIPLGYNTQLIYPPQYNTLTHACNANRGTNNSEDKQIKATQVWHIPIENDEDVLNFLAPPRTWLCLQQSSLLPNLKMKMENICIKDNEQVLDRRISDRYEIENKPWPKYKEQNSVNKRWVSDSQLENKGKVYSVDKMNDSIEGKYSVPWKNYKSNPSKQKNMDVDDYDFKYIGSKKHKRKDLTDGRKRKSIDRSKVLIKIDKIFEE